MRRTRTNSAPQKRRRLTLECLEPRLPLTASPVVGDATFVLYDGVEIGVLPTEFSRDATSIDGLGVVAPPDTPRFGQSFAYSPSVEWKPVDAPFMPQPEEPSFQVVSFGSGWDADGETPLTLFWRRGPKNDIVFASGETFEEVGRMPLTGAGSIESFEPNRRYNVEAAIVHHGLVVFAAQRSQDFGNGWEPVGVDFFATQDYGKTLQKVASADGGSETPSLPNGEGRGLRRMAQWAFMNPFPVNGIDDTQSVWFPWADYLVQSGPKGGQIGLFRADRSAETGEWIISPNRVIYETWRPEDSGGLHSHSAAVTDGGLISHWGDATYRNVTMFHEFDLENYLTAPVQTAQVFGSYSADPEVNRWAPQPAGVAPSPIPGEHIGTGDETPDPLLSFSPMQTVNDELEVRSLRYQPGRFSRGNLHDGPAILHIDWLQGGGYVAAGRVDAFFYFSRDGVNWSEINGPQNTDGQVWFVGADKLFGVRDGVIYVADTPTVEVVRPMQVEPGGVNRLAPTLEPRRAPGAGNSVRAVEYTGGLWRYSDTQVPLDVQADPPVFDDSTPVFEIIAGPDSTDFGSWWLMPEGATISTRPHLITDALVYNLGDQGATISVSNGVEGTTASTVAPLRYFKVSDNTRWVNVGASEATQFTIEGRSFADLSTQTKTPDSRFLLSLPYHGDDRSPTYPVAPGVTAPDEVAAINGFTTGDAWSVGAVARWPEDSQMLVPIKMPVASFTGPGGDAIEFSIDYSRGVLREADIVVEVYDDSELVGTHLVEFDILRGDTVEFVVSQLSGALSASIVIGGSEVLSSGVMASGVDVSLDRFQWSARDGDTVAGIEPVLVVVDDDAGWSTNEQAGWLRSSLSEKAVWQAKPAPGDFNFDGVVDQADFDVWQANLFVPNPGGPGDANGDGFVDDADAVIWQMQFAAREAMPEDTNSNGVVDAADYTVIVDRMGRPLPPRPGDANRDNVVDSEDYDVFKAEFGRSDSAVTADFNGNGVVDPADYTVWRDRLGVVYPDDPADVNNDGQVTDADLVMWESAFAERRVELAADFNENGVVDAADYTVWRDYRGPQVVPGTGADADGNGYVQDADATIWQANLGNVYPTLDDLRAAALGAPAAAVAEVQADPPASDEAIALLFAFAEQRDEPIEPPRRERAAATDRGARATRLLIDLRTATIDERPIEQTARSEDEERSSDGLNDDGPRMTIRRDL